MATSSRASVAARFAKQEAEAAEWMGQISVEEQGQEADEQQEGQVLDSAIACGPSGLLCAHRVQPDCFAGAKLATRQAWLSSIPAAIC